LARNDAYMGRGKKRTQRFWWVNRKERNRLRDRDVVGGGVRQMVYNRRWDSVDSFGSDGRVFDTCDYGNEFLVCLNERKFVT